MKTAAFVLLLTFMTNAPTWQDTSILKLDPAIPAANEHEYRDVRDAKDWRNPYIVILKDGLDVRTQSSHTRVPVSDLRQVLVRLPRTAWPYGRVVAVQEMSLRAVGGRDDAPIRENVHAAVEVLNALGIVVSYWPAG